MNNHIVKLINKYDHLSVAAKAGLWFTICGFVQKGINFITVPIFTRILTTDQYGVVSVFNSWEALLSVLCTLNLFSGGFNNGMLEYRDRRKEYISSIQGLITIITAAWIVIYLIGSSFWNNIVGMSSILILVMFIQVVATAALSLWSAGERYEFRYKKLVIITIANALLSSVLPIAAILVFNANWGAEVKIITQALVVLLICGSIYIYNFYKGKRFFSKNIWYTAFLFNLPLLPHYLSTMILNQADRIMIGKMVGNAEAGIYSIAYSISMVLNILVTAMNNSFAPWLYRRLETKDYKGVAKVANLMFTGVALVLILLIVFAPECIKIIAGEKYAEASLIIPSVASSLYYIFMYQIFANVEFFYKKNKFITYASVSGAILNIILNYIGIQLFGYMAAGYTTLICYTVFGIAHFYFMNRICKNEMNYTQLFDTKTIFLIAGILMILAIFMTLLYNYILIRYLILAITIIVVIINKTKIIRIIQKLKEE